MAFSSFLDPLPSPSFHVFLALFGGSWKPKRCLRRGHDRPRSPSRQAKRRPTEATGRSGCSGVPLQAPESFKTGREVVKRLPTVATGRSGCSRDATTSPTIAYTTSPGVFQDRPRDGLQRLQTSICQDTARIDPRWLGKQQAKVLCSCCSS